MFLFYFNIKGLHNIANEKNRFWSWWFKKVAIQKIKVQGWTWWSKEK